MERFEQTYCAQCGRSLGPGPCGVSHCRDHETPQALAGAQYRARLAALNAAEQARRDRRAA